MRVLSITLTSMPILCLVVFTALNLLEISAVSGQENQQRRLGGSGLGNYEKPPSPANDIPKHAFDVLLSRPTDSSIDVGLLVYSDGLGQIQYRKRNGDAWATTETCTFKSGVPFTIKLQMLESDSQYEYRWNYTAVDSTNQAQSPVYRFSTPRASGQPFSFSVTSDSHLDENSSGEVYLRTLQNALSDQPDFHLELGDTFMTGKYVRPELAYGQYLAQRYYLGQLCHSSAFYFAIGNHDGETPGRGSIAWATMTRKSLFPNPVPNSFYSGNELEEAETGLAENYYAWIWGDAQFIVLDPFRYSPRNQRGRRNGDSVENNWNWTLGEIQYRWLVKQLETTPAKYRFVFLHHLVGGATRNNRGGAEAASLWEWGGHGADGDDDFHRNRPNWPKPIHQLIKDHHVSIVFHGHDHLFVKQDLDGIVYQEVPQPSQARAGSTRTAEEYGYLNGEIQPSSGYIRVRVDSQNCRVDYVRTSLGKANANQSRNGEVTYSYVIPAFGGP